ncbi:hypothetical protein ACFY1J_34185 [Streptomyces sp. NPDC001406]|uniref:hypothetical protein n=1 Tax=Streptomyces sp. NPDC001406 TaxID=3364572 RepID=UPI0036B1F023
MDVGLTARAVSDFATAGAVVVGGVWSYFKFIQGQTFAGRVEIKIYQELHTYRNCHTLDVDITLRNIGISRINLATESCVVEIYGADAFPANNEVEWTRFGGALAFPLDDAVESGEAIHHKTVAPIPTTGQNGSWLAFRADVTVVAAKKRFRRISDEWHDHDIFHPPKPRGKSPSGSIHDHDRPQADHRHRETRDRTKGQR